MENKNKIICAVDTKHLIDVINAKKLKKYFGMFKLGLEFYMANGPTGLSIVSDRDTSIFLDLKLHDIPNTVAKTIEIFNHYNSIKMITVHLGDSDIIRAAVESVQDIDIIGVTLLTSIKVKNAKSIVLKRTEQALEGGAAGIVCSAKEVKAVRERFGTDFKIIVPGIRWGNNATNDQKRIGTPKQTIDDGADYLVVGRPILQAENPHKAANELLSQL